MNTEFPTGGTGAGAGGGMRARCVVHPDNLAGGTCTRCGNFLCYVDTEGGRFTTCEACRNRTSDAAFPLTRQSYSFQALWDHTWNMFKVHWLMLSVGLLVPAVVLFVLSLVAQVMSLPLMLVAGMGGKESLAGIFGAIVLSFGMVFVFFVAAGSMMLGYHRMQQDAQEGRAPDIGRMFSQFPKIGRLVLAGLLIAIAWFGVALVTSLLFGAIGFVIGKVLGSDAAVIALVPLYIAYFVALMYFLLPFQFILSELSLTEVGALDAIKNCWTIADGHRWDLVGVALLNIPISIAGMLACCVGIIPAAALSLLLQTNLHRALRNGANGVIGEAVP